MKLRITGLLLGILILVAVMVPAFAAVVDKSYDVELTVSDVSDAEQIEDEVIEIAGSAKTETQPEFCIDIPDKTMITLDANGENLPSFYISEVEPMSDSPYYLGNKQLARLIYEEIDGVNYVTVASFLMTINPETMVEESKGVINVDATMMSSVVELDGENMADLVEESLTLTAKKGNVYVVANNRYLYVSTGVKAIDGNIALPIEVLATICNLSVAYDAESGRVQLNHEAGTSVYLESGDTYYDENTLYWLSHIINAESGNQSLKGKLAVGNVVMNRVKSPGFPNNIRDVLFQRNQFSPAMSGSIYMQPNAESVVAAKLVMDGAVVLKNALFFNRQGMNTFASRNRSYITTIGAHSFYA